MNRITLLPEHVANQIAAGEVVERPASVVKELVENALDAQAKRIAVDIQAGGRSLIRVTDDGVGMSRDDALLCLERHATSKIRSARDLAHVATMGFRGEALPSIASVSRMTLTTREHGPDTVATQIIVHGGKIQDVKAAGAPPGTCVEVRQLFYNLPARRKFLRTEETEYTHVYHYLTLAALAHPEVAFSLTKDGRRVWQLPAVSGPTQGRSALEALRERMRAVMGDVDQLIALDDSETLPPVRRREAFGEDVEEAEIPPVQVRLWGFIGKPGVSRATRQDQHLFVNRRPVENRGLNFALLEGYHTALMKGRYPVCCLFLEIDPAEVDVNIHPAKREVKFHRERLVCRFVTRAVSRALLAFHDQGVGASPTGTTVSFGGVTGDARISTRVPVEHQPAGEGATTAARPVPTELDLPSSPGPGVVQPEPGTRPPDTQSTQRPPAESVSPAGAPPATAAVSAPVESRAEPVKAPEGERAVEPETPCAARLPATGDEPVPLLQVPLRVLGTIGKLYVVLESDRGLVLMDQHAAHERVLYEQMLKRLESGQAPSQRLLLPQTIELSMQDAHFLRQHLAALNRLGVDLSEFGERTFLLDALPPFVKVPDPQRFIRELIDELKTAGGEVPSLRLGEQTIAKTVCRHAVKANDPLTGPELENLIHDLRRCAMPYTCPHGRPTLIEINYRELEKKFGRLV